MYDYRARGTPAARRDWEEHHKPFPGPQPSDARPAVNGGARLSSLPRCPPPPRMNSAPRSGTRVATYPRPATHRLGWADSGRPACQEEGLAARHFPGRRRDPHGSRLSASDALLASESSARRYPHGPTGAARTEREAPQAHTRGPRPPVHVKRRRAARGGERGSAAVSSPPLPTQSRKQPRRPPLPPTPRRRRRREPRGAPARRRHGGGHARPARQTQHPAPHGVRKAPRAGAWAGAGLSGPPPTHPPPPPPPAVARGGVRDPLLSRGQGRKETTGAAAFRLARACQEPMLLTPATKKRGSPVGSPARAEVCASRPP